METYKSYEISGKKRALENFSFFNQAYRLPKLVGVVRFAL